MEHFLIVALGNPGEKYKNTRHNAGFLCIDFLREKWNFPVFTQSKQQADISQSINEIDTAKYRITLAKPTTFMNNSGVSVSSLCSYYDIELSHLIVIHDDSDFNFDKIVLQNGRNSGGHNGVQSIIDSVGSNDFYRVRVGVRPVMPEDAPHVKALSFVLTSFSMNEKKRLSYVFDEVVAIIEEIIYK